MHGASASMRKSLQGNEACPKAPISVAIATYSSATRRRMQRLPIWSRHRRGKRVVSVCPDLRAARRARPRTRLAGRRLSGRGHRAALHEGRSAGRSLTLRAALQGDAGKGEVSGLSGSSLLRLDGAFRAYAPRPRSIRGNRRAPQSPSRRPFPGHPSGERARLPCESVPSRTARPRAATSVRLAVSE